MSELVQPDRRFGSGLHLRGVDEMDTTLLQPSPRCGHNRFGPLAGQPRTQSYPSAIGTMLVLIFGLAASLHIQDRDGRAGWHSDLTTSNPLPRDLGWSGRGARLFPKELSGL